MTTAQTDAAIAWIRQQWQRRNRRPWMASVSYNAIHTPYQHPPVDLYPPGFVWPSGVPENCTDLASRRIVSDLMLAAMDREIGRLLVGIGLAQWDTRGRLVYRPDTTNTMVIIAGDNGTFLANVLKPYDPTRAKGTPYETDVLDLNGVRSHRGQPSVFDFNQDGITDDRDMPCVWRNMGNDCLLSGPGKACR